jgi:hypothetical protein
MVLVVTEILSAFSLLAFVPILISWLVILAIAIILLLKRRIDVKAFARNFWIDIRKTHQALRPVEKFFLYAAGVIFLLVFIQGMVYPPNNWDSLTYHMARIPNWLSQNSLAPYPTHIIRQIYQPPFAEYMIMHADVLNRGDVFSASIQFFFFVFGLTAVSGIVKSLGLNRYYQLLAVFLCATLPEALLQASSTQNDVVECFFVLSTLYFVIKALKENSFRNHFFVGLSIALAVMTKATAYVYLAPILIYYAIAIIIKLPREKRFTPGGYAMMAALLVIALNTPRIIRNYQASGNIWGTTEQELSIYSNTSHSPASIASVVVKNAGLHLGILGVKHVATVSTRIITQLHQGAHIDVNNPGNTYGKTSFSAPIVGVVHEDSAPNLLHLFMIIIAVIALGIHFIKGKRDTGITILFWLIFLQILLFCAYLRWQPWNSRLHIPMFMLGCVLVAYAISISRILKAALYIITPVLFIYGIAVILRNETRPYLDMTNGKASFSTISRPRYQNYFNNLPEVYPEYAGVHQQISRDGYENIGLILGSNDFEYPLFADGFSTAIHPVSIMVHNYTKSSANGIKPVDCIVSTVTNAPFIDYNGRRYYNKDSGNKFIHLYQ